LSPNALFIDSDGFELLIVLLKSLGVAEGAKVKASAYQLFLKGVAVSGKKFFYEIKALSSAGKRGRMTTVDDLIVICPNCHRALHQFRAPG
jgi:hypothetical protein